MALLIKKFSKFVNVFPVYSLYLFILFMIIWWDWTILSYLILFLDCQISYITLG